MAEAQVRASEESEKKKLKGVPTGKHKTVYFSHQYCAVYYIEIYF